MDLTEIKRITLFARKTGIKSIKIDGLELEMHTPLEQAPAVRRRPRHEEMSGPKAIPEPTLEQINEFIYGSVDEAV